MRVEQLGNGDPEVAVVGAIHGDEPCGAAAIDRLVRDDPPVERPAKLVVANEAALERGVRYLDADLNRAFGPDVSPGHEGRLAEALADELDGCLVLSIHSTRSYAEPFGLVNGTNGRIGAISPFLSVVALVDLGLDEEGRLFAAVSDLVEVEAGLQGTEAAAENAYRLAREFLTAAGVLPGPTAGRDLPVFRLGTRIEKPPAERYEVFVENFTRVERGEAFAAADGDPLVADEAFYPILLSADGYESVFGYAGSRVGTLEAPRTSG